jgi:predicted transposase/invertase (TIGR01784 family)
MLQTYDKLWKGIIEDLFDDFIHFFYTEWADKIDFDRGFEFLDQELAQLFPELESDNRTIDKLVKVFLKDGTEEWILIHIEVQGYEDLNFEERMYIYNYRIFDRFQKKISAIAIFTDKKEGYKPNTYHTECFGTEVTYHFRTYKVLEQKEEDLEQSQNPFAIVVLATLAAIKKGKKDDATIMDIKRNLARMLYERNYSKKKIISLFKFIQTYIRFDKTENYSIFADEILSIYEPNQKNMGVVEIIIEDIRQESLAKGLEQGIEKGLEQGIEKGKIILITNLIHQFPSWEDEKIADLAEVSVELVQDIRKKI